MIFKSIKWRLQIWYGLILVAVLVGFGVTAFQLERNRVLRRVDDELHRRTSMLANALRPPQRGPIRGQPPLDEPPPEQFNPPRPDHPLEEDNPILPQPPRQFHLPPPAASLFESGDSNAFYYVIRTRDGREFARSTNAPSGEMEFPKIENHPGEQLLFARQRPSEPLPPRMRGSFREEILITPPGEMILVGRSIMPELKELRFIALTLAAVGGGILLLGIAGGWWIASRAIRPIKDISAAATKISAGDLSQRISTSETESELGQLANVLNSTFARLEAAFAQQQQFTSDAAHELRTPVSVMLTQTQSALNRERNAAEYRETIEACQRAAQRMRRLIESLLELAQFDAGQVQMKRLQFDFSKTVRDCEELVKPLADERGVKIFSELAPTNCIGDSVRLSQVVTNLLTNAIQYNKPGGQVRVRLESRDDIAELIVSDNGAGIFADDLPRVFERFYRADKSRSTGGNGLGLAISKAVVEAHGGTIEVTSEPGAGATFRVRLPAAKG